MKRAEARRVAEEYVLPLVGEEAVLVRRVLVFTPVGLVVRGFSFGSSTSSATGFYVHAIADALYSPEDQAPGMPWVRSPRLIYDGGSLPAGEAKTLRKWLESEGLPLLERIRSPGDLAADIERRERGRPLNGLKEETRGYSLILAARDDDAREALQLVVDDFGRSNDLRDFEQEAVERARTMLERLNADRDAALEVLLEWRREKATRLGIAELLAPVTA